MPSLDQVLLAVDPYRNEVTFAPDAAARLAAATVASDVAAGRTRRRRSAVVVAGVVAFLALGSGAVSYAVGGMHTGWFVPQGATENGRAGDEELNLSDPGIVDVVRQEADKVALPPGAAYGLLLKRYPIPFKDGYGFTGTQQVVTQSVQAYAACLWMKDWLGQPGRRSADLAFMVANFPQWETGLPSTILPSLQNGDSGPLRQFTTINCGT
jgi:hypothetical protein